MPVFEQYFIDNALTLDLLQIGDARDVTTILQTISKEPCWPECPTSLLTPFPYGKFRILVQDAASGKLIFTKGFDTLFAEYATTKPALAGTKKAFQTTVRIPMPIAPVTVRIEHRLPDNSYRNVLSERIDPNDSRIRKESTSANDEVFAIERNGSHHECVDLVFLAEGYTANQKDKFVADATRMTNHLFTVEPYKENRRRFNVNGIFRASDESGADEPHLGIYRNTALNASFNTLEIDRYLLVEDNHRMHQMASRVPYDNIVVLVNTSTYGGGSICLDYCVCSASSPHNEMVFVHELGHGMSYLADEYIGNVSYNDMYPENVEPVEPNITRQLDPALIKWKSLLSKNVPIPTIEEIVDTTDPTIGAIVGAFEGGGYLSKGIYRPQKNCLMGSANPNERFCAVCQNAIRNMILHFSPSKSE